jgi:hypothetical protein
MSDAAAPHGPAAGRDPAARYRTLPDPVQPDGTTASVEVDPDADHDAEYREAAWPLRNPGA